MPAFRSAKITYPAVKERLTRVEVRSARVKSLCVAAHSLLSPSGLHARMRVVGQVGSELN